MRILSVGIVRASEDSCNNAGAGLHLVLDSTGLSIVGTGEWAAAKHGGRSRRGWRKLHLGVDQSGVIRVHTLTEATGDDATTALDLLTAVEGPLVRQPRCGSRDRLLVRQRPPQPRRHP